MKTTPLSLPPESAPAPAPSSEVPCAERLLYTNMEALKIHLAVLQAKAVKMFSELENPARPFCAVDAMSLVVNSAVRGDNANELAAALALFNTISATPEYQAAFAMVQPRLDYEAAAAAALNRKHDDLRAELENARAAADAARQNVAALLQAAPEVAAAQKRQEDAQAELARFQAAHRG